LLLSEVSDDGSCELKHVALSYVTLQCCVGRWISVVCDTKKTQRDVSE